MNDEPYSDQSEEASHEQMSDDPAQEWDTSPNDPVNDPLFVREGDEENSSYQI